MTRRSDRISPFLFAAALLFCAVFAHAQVPVAMAPPIHFQFLDAGGKPLANGHIFTYAAGTTTLLNTYTDAAGVAQNPDPIPLDASGSPTNGAVQTGIFLANLSYKFVGFDSHNVQQWSVDNVTSYFGLLNSANLWTQPNTFADALTILASDNQFALGAPGVQTTLDFPPPIGPIVLHFPSTADTIVGRATTDTLSNKTFVGPSGAGSYSPSLILAKNFTPVPHTGDTTIDTIYTVPIPILGTTSALRITMLVKDTVQGAGTTTVVFNLSGTTILSLGVVSIGQLTFNETLFNQNSVSVQYSNFGYQAAAATLNGGVGAAINTGVATTLTVTVQNANNSDAQTFEGIMVEIL